MPFAHATAQDVIAPNLAGETLRWLEAEAPWKLRIADFYEQWELHLESVALPETLLGLLDPYFVRNIARALLGLFVEDELDLVEVTAHKMLAGQTIRLHNDFIEDAESHRIIIQLNRGWRDDQGGLLMLFGSDSAEDIQRILRPLHRSAFAFAISDRSFHAVSTITEGERFTLVYSFKASTTRMP
jgi:Rps23 Pro-64 3,4-dihydroxylase Tpa1-like proline 4-hydroxylase